MMGSVTKVSDLLRRISITRLLIAVPVGFATTCVGLAFMGWNVHGPPYYGYIAFGFLMPSALVVFLFAPFQSNWFMLALAVGQSAFWYGLLSLLPEDRARLSDWRRL